MLAGAVALAAGRFQPLVRLDPVPATAILTRGEAAAGWPSKRFHDVLPLTEARGLARLIEARAAAVAGPHDRLGDACDFLTLAADWPYRYRNDAEVGLARGEHALDDLIGRVLDTDEGGLASSRAAVGLHGPAAGRPRGQRLSRHVRASSCSRRNRCSGTPTRTAAHGRRIG